MIDTLKTYLSARLSVEWLLLVSELKTVQPKFKLEERDRKLFGCGFAAGLKTMDDLHRKLREGKRI